MTSKCDNTYLCSLVKLIGNISNVIESNKTSQAIYNSFPSKYDSDQINEIIYRLYQDYLHSDKNDTAHYHYIAILIDFICSNKFYENNIEACDIVTEFPID
jgi:hypothetical protein